MKKIAVLSLILLLVCGCSLKTYTIKLEANASTGYEWVCTMNKKGIIKEVKSYYTESNSKLVGAPGIFTYKFKAIKAGTVILTCDYQKSHEENSTVKTEVYTFEVNRNLNIKGL